MRDYLRGLPVGFVVLAALFAVYLLGSFQPYNSGDHAGFYIGDCYTHNVGMDFKPTVRIYSDEC